MSSKAAQARKAAMPLRVRVRYTEAGTTVLVGERFDRQGRPRSARRGTMEADGYSTLPGACNCGDCMRWRAAQRAAWGERGTTAPAPIPHNRARVGNLLRHMGAYEAAERWRWEATASPRRLPR